MEGIYIMPEGLLKRITTAISYVVKKTPEKSGLGFFNEPLVASLLVEASVVTTLYSAQVEKLLLGLEAKLPGLFHSCTPLTKSDEMLCREVLDEVQSTLRLTTAMKTFLFSLKQRIGENNQPGQLELPLQT